MNSELFEDLKGENNFAFGQLYKDYFYVVSRYIVKNNGRSTDAEDVFQDTLIVLVEKLRQDDFQLTASLKTYILAIAKNIWLNRLRKNTRIVELTIPMETHFFEEIDMAIEAEKTNWDRLQNYMHQITDHCKGLIHDLFFKEIAIEEIQKKYQYTSKHNAQNQKHKCVEQIRRVKAASEK